MNNKSFLQQNRITFSLRIYLCNTYDLIEYQQNRISFFLRIFRYNMIRNRRNVTVEGISPYVLAIASILFSN